MCGAYQWCSCGNGDGSSGGGRIEISGPEILYFRKWFGNKEF